MKLLRRKYSLSEFYVLKKSLCQLILNPRKIFNLILVKISVMFRMEKCLGLPVNILIEPTGMCNYACVKCARFSDAFKDEGDVYKGKNISFEHFCQVIDEIGDTLLTLRLWRYGEPLLNRDLPRMIEYAKRKNIFVCVSSSLSALTERSTKELIDSGLDYLIVSFDGATEKTYNLYHGKRCYHQVVRNIKRLVALKKQLRTPLPFIDLQFIVMRENEGEITQMKALAKELGVDKLSFSKLDATHANLKKFNHFASQEDLLPKRKSFRLDSEEIKKDNFCSIPWEETLISYSGLVTPCAPDYSQERKMGWAFGNGHYKGFKAMWNNKEYRRMRRDVKSNIDSINCCRGCTKRNNSGKQQILENALGGQR